MWSFGWLQHMRHTYETIKGSKSLDMGRMARDIIAAIQVRYDCGDNDDVGDDYDDYWWQW